MVAKEIVEKYINFFVKRGHKQIANSPLVPENDPTTLFIRSGITGQYWILSVPENCLFQLSDRWADIVI